MEDPATTALFFDLYAAAAPPCAKLSIEVLVMLGSLRRSLFSSDEERQAFLVRMVRGTLHILQAQCGLADHDNYHELCRLLARLKVGLSHTCLAKTRVGRAVRFSSCGFGAVGRRAHTNLGKRGSQA